MIVSRAPIKQAKTRACPTKTEKRIADFRAAKRTWRKADRDLQALLDRHPDLKDHIPAVLLYTTTSGDEVYVTTETEAERLLPSSYDEAKPLYVALRKDFAKRLGPARKKHREQRKLVGITKAENDKLYAFLEMKSAFQTLCRHKPKSVQDIAMMAGVIRQGMGDVVRCAPDEIGGLYGDCKALESFPEWRHCRSQAVDFFAAFLSTLSKAG